MAGVPLIALELLFSLTVIGWAVWELVSLRRSQRRDAERAAATEAARPRDPVPPGD